MNAAPPRLQRPPPAVPPTQQNNDQIAYFFHPAYPPPLDLLFTLPCVDRADAGESEESEQPDVLHHHTALIACQIIANNAFDSGQLYFDRQGAVAVSDRIPRHGVLRPGRYFFVVNSDPAYRYPVVPSFREWRFPHDAIPDAWTSPKRDGSIDVTRRCAVTNHFYGLKKAHIVPREEGKWFIQNAMSRYGGDMRDVNDSRNVFRLRADMHHCFDARFFTMVPKPEFAPASSNASSSTGGLAFVVHVFQANVGEFSSPYHNTRLQYLDNLSREFIFARFAWTVIMLVKPFLLLGTPRSVIRCHFNQGITEWKAQDLSGHKLSSLYGGGGSRNASPKKRRRQCEDDDTSLADSDEWYDEASDQNRGRKRVRCHFSPRRDSQDEMIDIPLLSSASSSSVNDLPSAPTIIATRG